MRALFALFVRTLRQSTRAPSTYLLRGAVALLVLLFLWSAHESLSWAGAAGRRFFGYLVAANYFFVTLLGLGSFASAIAEEKEEGTLGLMRMADLSPLAILFGKSTSRLGIVSLLFLAQVPFAFLAVTLGGVSQTQIFTAFALLATYLFALANISLFFSVRLPASSRAASMTFALIVGYSLLCGAPFMFAEWLIEKHGYLVTHPTIVDLRSAGNWLWSVHPGSHCFILAQGGFLTIDFTRSMIVHLSVGVAFFLFSLLIFERYCGDEAAYSGKSGKPKMRWRWLGRPKRASGFGVAWKDFNFVGGGRPFVLLRCVLYALAVFLIGWSIRSPYRHPEALSETAMVAWVLGLAMLHIELVIRALLMWGPEAWGQHVGSLIATPMALRRINWEKLKGMVMAAFPPLFLLLLAFTLGGSKFVDEVLIRPFQRTYSGPWGIPMNYWFLVQIGQWIVQFALLLFLIVNLSLRLKWTALPAALGIFVIYQIVFNIVMALIAPVRTLAWGPWFTVKTIGASVIGLIVIWLLTLNTRTLLLRRAAEG